eukprot:XP_001696101.1 predicted protein [Chlamydomonas reinhardtii]
MATVLLQHGEPGPDGSPPPRAYFQLIDGKLHLPTIRDYFKLANVALDGVVYPTDPDGFTFNTFEPNTTSRVTGDPLLSGARQTRILLIRCSEGYAPDPADQSHQSGDRGTKRKLAVSEETLGLWTLPPPETQPRTLLELSGALKSFLQMDGAGGFGSPGGGLPGPWLFKSQLDDESANQQCRLYLWPALAPMAPGPGAGSGEEAGGHMGSMMAPRDLIRARITGQGRVSWTQPPPAPPNSYSRTWQRRSYCHSCWTAPAMDRAR